MNTANAIHEEIVSLQAYLKAAEEVLFSGYMPDITGMETRIAVLCDRITKAPKELHEKSVEELTLLLDALNQLEKRMQDFHALRTRQ